MDLRIQYQCPQCGAPTELTEDQRLLRCAFCRVRSCLVVRSAAQYRLPARSVDPSRIVYVPYWRMRGIRINCTADGVSARWMDTSACGIDHRSFPPSLGLRSQALTLRMVGPQDAGTFLKYDIPAEAAEAAACRRHPDDCRPTVLHQAFVGDTLSLIYAPFYAGERLYDAVLDTPVSTLPPPADLSRRPTVRPGASVSFHAALCPHCGWDLQGDSASRVLLCANCRRFWRTGRSGLRPMTCARSPIRGPVATAMPFYRIRARIDGLPLDTFADLIREANLPRVVRSEDLNRPFRFWVPAVKLRPQLFLRLARSLTLAQLPAGRFDQPAPETLLPVTLPLDEALQSLTSLLAAVVKPQRRRIPAVVGLEIQPLRWTLVYLALEEAAHDWLLPGLSQAISKNALSLSGKL